MLSGVFKRESLFRKMISRVNRSFCNKHYSVLTTAGLRLVRNWISYSVFLYGYFFKSYRPKVPGALPLLGIENNCLSTSKAMKSVYVIDIEILAQFMKCGGRTILWMMRPRNPWRKIVIFDAKFLNVFCMQ